MKARLFLVLTVAVVAMVAYSGPLWAGDEKPINPTDPQLGPAPSTDNKPTGGDGEAVFGPSAVATRYAFASSAGTYSEISGGTLQCSGTTCDDSNHNAINIGFTFTFDGTAYTQASVNDNGFLAMGATVVSSYYPISSGTSNNVISALGGDLQGQTTGELRTQTLGTTPNQVFVVQYKNWRAYSGTDSYNMQIRLYETSNRIEVVYGAFTEASSYTRQVGLRGASSADFNNRTTSTNWAASTAGATNTATMTLSSTVLPPNGLTYAWFLAPSLVYGSSAVVSDTCANGGPGQGNGIIDAGETVDLDVTLNNTGTLGATGVSATLSTTTPGVQVLTSGANFPDIPSGGSGTSITHYEFYVDGTFACGGSITFQLAIYCNEANFTRTFSLDVGSKAVVFSENFDSVTAPALPTGWAMVRTAGTVTTTAWATNVGTRYPSGNPSHSAPNLAYFNSFSVSAGNAARLYQNVSGVDLSAWVGHVVTVQLWMFHDTGYTTADTVQVQLSTDAGGTWTNVGAALPRYDGSVGWKQHSVDISSYAGLTDVRLGFNATSAYGNDCHIDDVAVVAWTCGPCYGLWLSPDTVSLTGCPGLAWLQQFSLLNTSGSAGTFDLSYTVSANAAASGPAQLALADGQQSPFMVSLTPRLCLADNDVATVDIGASGNGFSDSSTMTETITNSPFWVPIATEPNSGRMDNVVAAYNGLVWSITGYGASAEVRTYDPVAGTWSVVPGSAPSFGVNYAHSGCQHGSKVYVYADTATTGFATTGLWSYNMASNTWTNEAPTGTPPTATGLWAPAWVHDPESGYCYLTGGSTSTSAGFQTTVYVYDPGTNAWLTQLPNFTSDRRFHAAFIYHRVNDGDTKLLCVVGGINQASTYLASTQCYDFTAAAWDAENAASDLGALPTTWWAMAYGDKWHWGTEHELYMVGGVFNGGITNISAYWDVNTNFGWYLGGYLATSPIYRVAMTTLNNELYKIGGSTGGFSYTGLADHHIQCPECEADLSITKDDGVTTVYAGGTVTYTITVSNPANADVTGATVTDTFPATLLNVTWTCVGSGGGSCTGSGTGNISDTVNLPAGSSVVYTVHATVDPNAAVGTLANTATVTPSADIPDPDMSNNSATDTDTLERLDLAITKTDGIGNAVPGTPNTYTITVSNVGSVSVVGASVQDLFPPEFLGVTWTCGGGGGGACTGSGAGNISDLVNLPVGAYVVYTATGTIDLNATGTLSNTATVTPPAGPPDANPGNNSATDIDTLNPPADLAITKTDGVTSVVPGTTVTYTIVVTNNGPGDTGGAPVTDTFAPILLSPTWTCVAGAGAACTPSGTGNISDSVTIPHGVSVVYTATATVNPAATGTLVNTATVQPPTGQLDLNPGNNISADSDTLTPQANLGVTKSNGVSSVVPGTAVTYTISVSNTGPSSAPGVPVNDTFPPEITGVTWTCVGSGGGTCTVSGSGNIADSVNLPVGASVVYTAHGTVAASATGTLVNTAQAVPPPGVVDPVPANNSATDADPLTPVTGLAITKDDGVTSVNQGGSLTYTITVTNAGPSDGLGATVVDNFPADLVSVSWTCVGSGGGTCAASGSGNINDAVNVPVGAAVVYTANATVSSMAEGVLVDGQPSLVNTATVFPGAGATDPNLSNNTATDIDTIESVADLKVRVTDGTCFVLPGDSTTYAITVTNNGPNPVLGGSVVDTFPSILTGVTWTCVGTGGGICGASGTGNINETFNVPAGASVTYSAHGTVLASASGTMLNTASAAVPADMTDPVPTNDMGWDLDALEVPVFCDDFESGNTSAWPSVTP